MSELSIQAGFGEDPMNDRLDGLTIQEAKVEELTNKCRGLVQGFAVSHAMTMRGEADIKQLEAKIEELEAELEKFRGMTFWDNEKKIEELDETIKNLICVQVGMQRTLENLEAENIKLKEAKSGPIDHMAGFNEHKGGFFDD
jgi:DNA-binding GntR family transcriptional regulator